MKLPLLFIQGTEDMVAREDLMDELVVNCSPWAVLRKIAGADHTFRTEAGTGPHSALVLDMVTLHLKNWLLGEVARKSRAPLPATTDAPPRDRSSDSQHALDARPVK